MKFNPNVPPTQAKKIDEKEEKKEDILNIDYSSFHLSIDKKERTRGRENPSFYYTDEEKKKFSQKKVEKFFSILEKNNIIISKNPLVLDLEKAKDVLLSVNLHNQGIIPFKRNIDNSDQAKIENRYLPFLDCFNLLGQLKCFSKEEFNMKEGKIKDDKEKLHPAFNLPKNKQDLASGNMPDKYLDFMDFVKKPFFLLEKVVLEDGTDTNYFEIFLAKKLREFKAHRDQFGKLKITDPFDGQIKNYSLELMYKIIGKKFGSKIDREPGENEGNIMSGSFLSQKFLKNLFDATVFEVEDLKILGNTPANEIYSANEKRLNPKAPYVSFSNKFGGARYYIGRNEIVGTNKKIDENLYSKQLDDNLVGILEKIPNKTTRLLYVFNGLNKEEYEEKKQKVDELFIHQNKIPKKEKESTEEYAERISRLSDFNYVMNSFRKFFSEIQIGVHKLSWAEQLSIANFLLDQKNDDTLKSFAKEHKINGLRTFLSIEQGGKPMGDKILELGEKLPKDVAGEVFKKYGEIIDSTNSITQMIQERFSAHEDPQIISKISESLMKKGKDLLLESSEMLKMCTGVDCTDVSKKLLEDLNNFSQDNVLLGSVFKTLSKEKTLKLEDVKDVKIEKLTDPKELEKYHKKMVKVFEQNRKDYPDELLKESLEEFEQILKNPDGSEFYILKNKEDILGYMRFEDLPNGNVYFGSYNGTSDTRGLALNGVFLKELLDEKSKKGNVEAVVFEKNPIKDVYIKNYGFEVVGEIENYKGTGQKFSKILLKKREVINSEKA